MHHPGISDDHADRSCAAQDLADRAQCHLRSGDAHLTHWRLDSAVADYLQAVQLDPGCADAFIGLGSVYAERRQWSDADQTLRHALAARPGCVTATGRLGAILNAQQRYAEAIPLLETASGADRASKPLAEHRRDARHNLATAAVTPRVMLVRHPTNRVGFYQVWLDWVSLNFPECLTHFELRLLPCTVRQDAGVTLSVVWLQDPVEDWSQATYRHANALAAECRTLGISTINPVDSLANASKIEGTRRIAQAGFRTPQMVLIQDIEAFKRDAGGLTFPICVREDRGHQKPILRADDLRELEGLSLEGFERPIGVEIVDVRGPDGLYRKYRYIAAGDHGVSHHLQITPHWVTRGEDRIANDATKAEELAYVSGPDPHHGRFQDAMRALELDFAAFDYGYDRDGNAVVWEANPYPFIRFCSIGGSGEYRHAPMHRTMAAMLAMYLERAGIPAPDALETILAIGSPESDRIVAQLMPPVPDVIAARLNT